MEVRTLVTCGDYQAIAGGGLLLKALSFVAHEKVLRASVRVGRLVRTATCGAGV